MSHDRYTEILNREGDAPLDAWWAVEAGPHGSMHRVLLYVGTEPGVVHFDEAPITLGATTGERPGQIHILGDPTGEPYESVEDAASALAGRASRELGVRLLGQHGARKSPRL